MSLLISSLHDIYPLLVGSGVAIAFVHLVDRQSKPEKIPPFARRCNVWGATLASLCTVAASFTALYYAGLYTKSSMIEASYALLMLAFLFLILAFLIPTIVNFIHPLWARSFYSQFEKAQAKDAKEAREAIHRAEDADETTTE